MPRRTGRMLKQTTATVYPRPSRPLHTRTRQLRRRPANAGKRAATGTTWSRTVKRRSVQNKGQSQEYSRYKENLGRYGAPTLRQAFKELRASQEKVVYGHRNFGDFTVGAHPLAFANVGVNEQVVPLCLYDLTCVNTIRNNNYLTSRPFMNMYLENATGAVTFKPLNGVNATGVIVPELQLLRAGQGNINDHVDLGERTLLKWIHIKLNLFGARAKVTKWCIQLVKLRDEQLDPYDKATVYNASLTKFNGFWQALVKPFTLNPIADQTVRASKDLQVLQTWTFVQDANTTIEQDTAPKCKEVNLFIKKNQVCKWDNFFVEKEGTADEVTANNGFLPSFNGSVNSYLLPKYKTYLLIRAMNIGKSDDVSSLTNPSLDWNIKNCHVKID